MCIRAYHQRGYDPFPLPMNGIPGMSSVRVIYGLNYVLINAVSIYLVYILLPFIGIRAEKLIGLEICF